MAGSDSSSIPAEAPILKGVLITLDFKKIEEGESDVFFNEMVIKYYHNFLYFSFVPFGELNH